MNAWSQSAGHNTPLRENVARGWKNQEDGKEWWVWFKQVINDNTCKDRREEMRRGNRKGTKIDEIPHVRPADWLDVASFFFFLHLQLDHVKVKASLLAQRPDAKLQRQQENPEEKPEEPQPGGGVGGASNTNTFHSTLNNSALYLWAGRITSNKAAPLRWTDKTRELGIKFMKTCIASH